VLRALLAQRPSAAFGSFFALARPSKGAGVLCSAAKRFSARTTLVIAFSFAVYAGHGVSSFCLVPEILVDC
jgi:hypothetical protein